MILGPRGITQKQLETKSGCKISIRGKGSSKQKRMEYDSDEPLHVLIQGDTDENLEKGGDLVEKMLRGDIEGGEGDEIKKNQLMQLAAIQGTLRDDWCDNCGEKGHRVWACPNKSTSWRKVEVVCAICKDRSHPTSDCPQKKIMQNNPGNMFQEYSKFMDIVDGGGKGSTTDARTSNTSFLTNTTKPILPLMFGTQTYAGNTFMTNALNQMVATPKDDMFSANKNLSYGNQAANSTTAQLPQFSMPQFKQNQNSNNTNNSNMAPNPAHFISAYSMNPNLSHFLPPHLYNPNYQATAITVTNVGPNTPSPYGVSTQQQTTPFNAGFMNFGTQPLPGVLPNPQPFMVGFPQSNLGGSPNITLPNPKLIIPQNPKS